jgi:glycosyltransferase involved in cell wall biosynthesis
MRVLLSFEQLGPVDGVTRGAVEVAEALCRRGHEFVVAYRVPDSFLSRWKALGSDLVQVPSFEVSRRHPFRSLMGAGRSVKRMISTHPDVVYCSMFHTLPFSAAVARRLRVPLVVHVKQPVPESSRSHRWLVARLLRRATAIACMSDYLKRTYKDAGLVGDRAWVIPDGVDLNVYRPPTDAERAHARESLGIPCDQPVVLYLGRLDPDKGIETLIDALGRMRDERVIAIIAGAATLDAFRRDARSYANSLMSVATERIRFLGRHDDVRQLVWASDVVAVPSIWPEPFGRVPLEAMACGVPAVASRVGGLPEMFQGGLEELLVEPGDPDALAGALAAVLSEGGSRRYSREILRARVARHFALDSEASSLESLLSECIAV